MGIPRMNDDVYEVTTSNASFRTSPLLNEDTSILCNSHNSAFRMCASLDRAAYKINRNLTNSLCQMHGIFPCISYIQHKCFFIYFLERCNVIDHGTHARCMEYFP